MNSKSEVRHPRKTEEQFHISCLYTLIVYSLTIVVVVIIVVVIIQNQFFLNGSYTQLKNTVHQSPFIPK